jgi:hypothetical protein
MGRLSVAALLAAAGCYSPHAAPGAPCSPDLHCPTGLVCDTTQSPPLCVETPGGGTRPDSNDPDIDAPLAIDAAPDAPSHAIPTGAKLWLQMDDDPNDGVYDSMQIHNALCSGTCPTLITGKIGGAYQFTNNAIISIAAATDLSHGTAFTVAAWIRVDSTQNQNGLIASKQTAPSNGSYALIMQSSMKTGYYSNPGSFTSGSNAWTLGQWHHVTYTWDGTNKKGYYDGVSEATGTASNLVADDTAPFLIGGDTGSATLYFHGSIDDLVVYNRVLTAMEIAQLASGM